MKEPQNTYLSFSINDQLFAIPLNQIKMVIRAVAVTSVPNGTKEVYGVIDYYGNIIPVVNTRECLGFGFKEITPEDRFIIVNNQKHPMALVVDSVDQTFGVNDTDLTSFELPGSGKHHQEKHENEPGLRFSKRFFRSDKGIIIIYDVGQLINSDLKTHVENLLANISDNVKV